MRIATDQDEVKLDYWCFSPALALQDLRSLGVSSVLCASGTLSPPPFVCGRIRITTYVGLQNPHVVDAEKDLLCAVVGSGPNNVALKSTYTERRTIGYKQELGLTICQAAEQLDRGGLLVFFPSYPALNDAVEHWRGSSLWSRLGARSSCCCRAAQGQGHAFDRRAISKSSVDDLRRVVGRVSGQSFRRHGLLATTSVAS